ncbi:glycoside hydrolase [Paenibacillus piscarius]|uniref:glycoside hydrolase n=1 Tax=Paenibacillus piscarius TaxID=1089681 RepID=UPI001EE89301|nr:glycoside hydrolase [Paenibacillus piscarius]
MRSRRLMVAVGVLVSAAVVLGVFGLFHSPASPGSNTGTNSNKIEEETPVQHQIPPDAVITIDGSIRYQTIDNFGASDAWSMDPLGKDWTEENKNKVADLLFSRDTGIGLSAWRFNIGAGSAETDQAIIPDPWRRSEAFKMTEDGPYNWSRQAGQQWFLRAAKERGVESLIAFVNSPPVWMTRNGHAQPGPDVGSSNLKEGAEADFAAFLIDVLRHFEEEGLEFDYISPINEPTWDWNLAQQEASRYNNEDLKRVILELNRQLRSSGLMTQISAPDGVEITSLLDDEHYREFTGSGVYSSGANSLGLGKYREYIKELLGDPELKAAVGNKIASHSYWSDYSHSGDDRLVKLRRLLDSNLKQYDPQAKYWVTEYCIMGDYGPGRDLGMEPALQVARTIHFDLTEANAAAWQWWTAVSKVDYKDGLIYTDFKQAGDEQNILTSKILWSLGNYSRFIRPGAERIALTGLSQEAGSGLLGSAYWHEGEQSIAAVLVNDSDEDRRVQLTLSGLGLKASSLKSYVTSAQLDLARGEDAAARGDQVFEAVIPAKSVVTLVAGGPDSGGEAAVSGQQQRAQANRPAQAAQAEELPPAEAYAGYLFSYFTGEGTEDGEQVYFALSEGNDPLHWKELNGGRPVLTSTLGAMGVRDPFILRSPEGDRFYLIATDLKINGNWDWGAAQTQGSRAIIVWESDNLVDWSAPREALVSPAEAGNTWAPEAFYDPESGEYIVFWASRMYADASHSGDAYQKMMYSKTRDFRTFTEPQIYMDYGYSVIDTTMVAHNGKIYRFTKDEREQGAEAPFGKMVFQESLDSIFTSAVKRLSDGVGGVKGIEGPTLFKSNTEEKWYLFVDEFGGRGYIPLETEDLDSGEWRVAADYSLPASPRHGTVIPVTQREYEALSAQYLQ